MRFGKYQTVAAAGLTVFIMATISIRVGATTQSDPDPAGDSQVGGLTLEAAITRVLGRHPMLRQRALMVQSHEAVQLQRSLRPNPELGFDMENFAGTGEYRGFDGSEFTLAVGQLVELAGKRSKRTDLARAAVVVAERDYASSVMDVITLVTKGYIRVLAAQERSKLLENLVFLAQKVVDVSERRVRAGRSSPAESSRAKVRLNRRVIGLEATRSERDVAIRNLAVLLGDPDPDFDHVDGAFDSTFTLPGMDIKRMDLTGNPDMARMDDQIEVRRLTLTLEEAQSVPDPFVSAGYRYWNLIESGAFVASVSLPLPLFDSNQGNIERAALEIRRSEAARDNALLKLRQRIIQLHAKLEVLHSQGLYMKEAIIPEAENAFDIISRGYASGKYPLIDVLEAQETLFEVRLDYLGAQVEFHTKTVEIRRLTGAAPRM